MAAGLWNVYRAFTTKFEDKWRTGQMSEAERTWGSRVGVAGHPARGVVLGLIGVFIVKAAMEYDPNEAIGLDGALQKLANTTYGPYLLINGDRPDLLRPVLPCRRRYRDVSVGA